MSPSLSPTLPALRLGSGDAQAELRFSTLTPDVVARAVALGARVEHVSLRYARLVATVPLAALADLAALPGLTAIHPLYGAQTSVGSVETQVRAVLDLDAVSTQFGVDGTGVRIGLLSDSISNHHGGSLLGEGCTRTMAESAAQLTGDLPPAMIVLDPGPPSGRDEGTGMGEIVHDLAPGAALLFASAFPDEATFAENILALRACGADVIADDVLFFAEPMFQDGIIAQAVDTVAADGAIFFSASANASDAGIDQVYRDSDPRDDQSNPPTGVDLHDFGAGLPYTAISVPAHCDVRAVLQWNEPFSGTLGPGAQTDLDLYFYNMPPPTGRILSSSTGTQGCSAGGGAMGDPLEITSFRNGGGTARVVYLAVDHVCGDESVRMRIVLSSSTCVLGVDGFGLERGPFGAAALYGHPAATGALALAAIDHGEISSGGAIDAARRSPRRRAVQLPWRRAAVLLRRHRRPVAQRAGSALQARPHRARRRRHRLLRQRHRPERIPELLRHIGRRARRRGDRSVDDGGRATAFRRRDRRRVARDGARHRRARPRLRRRRRPDRSARRHRAREG